MPLTTLQPLDCQKRQKWSPCKDGIKSHPRLGGAKIGHGITTNRLLTAVASLLEKYDFHSFFYSPTPLHKEHTLKAFLYFATTQLPLEGVKTG